MNESNLKLVLVVLVLFFAALILWPYMKFHAYSAEEVREELSALCTQYAELRARDAEDTEWQAFGQKAFETTEPLIADMEKHYSPEDDGEYPRLYQLAVHHLPEAIRSAGRRPEEYLAQYLLPEKPRSVRGKLVSRRNKRTRNSNTGADPVIVGMLLFDGGLLVAVGYMLFWPAGKRPYVLTNKESMLRQLDRKISRKPESVRYLGMRARLLSETGRHKDAIADIDMILERQPHGVNLDAWRRLRESIVKKATAKE